MVQQAGDDVVSITQVSGNARAGAPSCSPDRIYNAV